MPYLAGAPAHILQRYVFFHIFAPLMRNRSNIFFFAAVAILSLASCSKDSLHGDGFSHEYGPSREPVNRVETHEQRNVLLLYSAGHNSISSYLTEDIEDLQQGWIPGDSRNENILLVYSHQVKDKTYAKPSSPTLTRLSKDAQGNIIRDTLKVYPGDTRSATAGQLHEVLSYVQDRFPANGYGMIFSSHATGYLPEGYYSKPEDYVFTGGKGMMYRAGKRVFEATPIPYHEPEHDPSLPAVKSIGQDLIKTSGTSMSYEIELGDFAEAIPMKLDYILFDACLMGGVEVAYELRGKCRYVGFSQAEVLAEGFDYKAIASHLIGSDTPDPKAVCEDYFLQYDIQSGIYRSATISMADCSQMEPLAETCRELFEKYRDQIARLKPNTIQQYYRFDYHWFYDLTDIVAKAGATAEELEDLQDALNKCIVYKASTPEFMGSFRIDTFSGFSMYLPCNGSRELDKYYKTLEWNKATGLVE